MKSTFALLAVLCVFVFSQLGCTHDDANANNAGGVQRPVNDGKNKKMTSAPEVMNPK